MRAPDEQRVVPVRRVGDRVKFEPPFTLDPGDRAHVMLRFTAAGGDDGELVAEEAVVSLYRATRLTRWRTIILARLRGRRGPHLEGSAWLE